MYEAPGARKLSTKADDQQGYTPMNATLQVKPLLLRDQALDFRACGELATPQRQCIDGAIDVFASVLGASSVCHHPPPPSCGVSRCCALCLLYTPYILYLVIFLLWFKYFICRDKS
jgi:hypothetical protein